MFRPDDTPPSSPPSRPEHATSLPQRMDSAATSVPKVYAPLPSNWEQMELDQRVRCVGEW
jgi:hypothetical protein